GSTREGVGVTPSGRAWGVHQGGAGQPPPPGPGRKHLPTRGPTRSRGPSPRLTDNYLHFKPLGLVAVKGLGDPVDVFELTGAEPTGTRFRFSGGSRGLTHFVGRQDELKSLHDALDRAEAGSGQIVSAVGERGLGKSRLFHELVRSSRARSWLALETGSVSYGQMTAWMPLRDLLRTYFQIEARAIVPEIQREVATRLAALDPSMPDFLSA